MIHTILHVLLQFWSKLSVKAMGSSGCSFPFTISVIEVFLNSLKACNGNLSASSFNSNYTVCEAIFNEVIEGVAVAVVGKPVIGSGEFLEALRGDACEIAGELSVFRQNHRAPRHEAVDQRLLPHISRSQFSILNFKKPNLNLD
uniref:Vesicle-associated membrane protein n=1 Tax=Rhizophora mucronata TaxID=61149 RepID=A0A2P2JY15_RHIMU